MKRSPKCPCCGKKLETSGFNADAQIIGICYGKTQKHDLALYGMTIAVDPYKSRYVRSFILGQDKSSDLAVNVARWP